MGQQIQKITKQLYDEDRTILDIVKTYKDCSKDDTNDRYLVNSQIKAIDFDKLTSRKVTGKKSADSLNFANEYSYLIEFKTGDQVTNESKREKLILGVLGKINDSGNTLFTCIYPSSLDEIDYPKIRFYLVVDSKTMGIDAYAIELAKLSNGAMDPHLRLLYDKVLPNLISNTNNPERFDKIDIWYSDYFDSYLKRHGIGDIIFPTT